MCVEAAPILQSGERIAFEQLTEQLALQILGSRHDCRASKRDATEKDANGLKRHQHQHFVLTFRGALREEWRGQPANNPYDDGRNGKAMGMIEAAPG
jgi:hypothetical protein